VGVTGLAAFGCKSALGVVCNAYPRARLSACNFTSVDGSWGEAYASGIYQSDSGSSTDAKFTLLDRCVGGRATFYQSSASTAAFRECIFVKSDGVVGHSSQAAGQDTVESCFLDATPLKGTEFGAGSVLIKDCLFSGAMLTVPAGFIANGVQLEFAGTHIDLVNQLLLSTCPSQGIAVFLPLASATETSTDSESEIGAKSATPSFRPATVDGGMIIRRLPGCGWQPPSSVARVSPPAPISSAAGAERGLLRWLC
jgi:hypothetical protein